MAAQTCLRRFLGCGVLCSLSWPRNSREYLLPVKPSPRLHHTDATRCLQRDVQFAAFTNYFFVHFFAAHEDIETVCDETVANNFIGQSPQSRPRSEQIRANFSRHLFPSGTTILWFLPLWFSVCSLKVSSRCRMLSICTRSSLYTSVHITMCSAPPGVYIPVTSPLINKHPTAPIVNNPQQVLAS